MTYKQLWQWIYPYLKRQKSLSFVVIGVVLILALVSRLLPHTIGWAIDLGYLKKDTPFIYKMAFLYLGLEIARELFYFLNIYLFQRLGNRMLYYIREDLVKHVMQLPVSYFNKNPAGRIVTRITNDVNTLAELFNDGVVAIFTNLIILVSIVIAMSFINLKLTIYTLFLTPLFVFFAIRITEKIRLILGEMKKKMAAINSFVAENLSGIRVVQLYNLQSKHLRRFRELTVNYKALNLSSIRHYAFLHPMLHLFSSITVAITLFKGGLMTNESTLQVGALIAFFLHVQDFIMPLRDSIEKFQQFQNSLTSAERLLTILDEPTEGYRAGETKMDIKGQVEFRELSFRYEPHLDLVLKNINLEINQGTRVALVGRTGSGKTTFISLMQRFYAAPPESLFVDGRPIEVYDLQELRRHIGVVQQDPFLFRATISDNISLFDPAISLARTQMAAEIVGLSSLLDKSGRNLSFNIEERGANLSVGERQLVSLARIIAFNPQILILDEATANVDSETELLVQKATQQVTKGRTSFIIAHRLSTVRDCDLILVLDKGELVEQGTHTELLRKKGPYFQMVNTQFQESV